MLKLIVSNGVENTWWIQLTKEFCSDSVDPKLTCATASGEEGDLLASSSGRATGARFKLLPIARALEADEKTRLWIV